MLVELDETSLGFLTLVKFYTSHFISDSLLIIMGELEKIIDLQISFLWRLVFRGNSSIFASSINAKDWIFVLPSIHILKSNAQFHSIRGRAFERHLCHENGVLINGICALKERNPRELACTFQRTVYEAEALTNQALNLPAPWSWTF